MLSFTAEYALRAVVVLAHHRPQPLITPRIAELTQAPCGYLAKVLQTLARKGLVVSQRGLRGGFLLARDPAGLTVLEIVEAVEPSRRIVAASPGADGVSLSLLNARIAEVSALVTRCFADTTVAQLLEPSRPAAGPLHSPGDMPEPAP
jgi:Rrf2 family protein